MIDLLTPTPELKQATDTATLPPKPRPILAQPGQEPAPSQVMATPTPLLPLRSQLQTLTHSPPLSPETS